MFLYALELFSNEICLMNWYKNCNSKNEALQMLCQTIEFGYEENLLRGGGFIFVRLLLMLMSAYVYLIF